VTVECANIICLYFANNRKAGVFTCELHEKV
jgi:hypothetical protein